MLGTILSHLPAHWFCVHALKKNVGSHTLRFNLQGRKKKNKSDSILSAKLSRVKKLQPVFEVFRNFPVSSHLVLCFGNDTQFADKKASVK